MRPQREAIRFVWSYHSCKIPFGGFLLHLRENARGDFHHLGPHSGSFPTVTLSRMNGDGCPENVIVRDRSARLAPTKKTCLSSSRSVALECGKIPSAHWT